MTALNALPLILANISHAVCCVLGKEMPSQDKWGTMRPGNEGTRSVIRYITVTPRQMSDVPRSTLLVERVT